MADNFLMLDGKKYELSPELANALRSCVEPEPEKKSPFERVESNTPYHFISYDGTVGLTHEAYTSIDDGIFSVANYCTDKALMEQRALHETLNRLLWRYSEEHGGDADWNGEDYHYSIIYDDTDGFFGCASNVYHKGNGVVYFKDRNLAEAAIAEIVKPFLAAHPDFVW